MKKTLRERIFKFLLENGIEYSAAYELAFFQVREGLKLLNNIKKQKGQIKKITLQF